MVMLTLDTLQTILLSLTELSAQPRYCVAYSGGHDSHVLLHAMANLRDKNNFNLRAIHVHHGLSPHADAWAAHCQRVCDQLSIPLTLCKITLPLLPGDSVEAVARDQRYAVFSAQLMPAENLLTAHTANDQAETFLLQLLRGAGVTGLSAMPAKKTLGTGFLLRPLLDFSREALTQYATQHALQWIEDESNESLRFNRNFLRHQVLPMIQTRWPNAITTISRSAAHCANATALLDAVADQDLANDQHRLDLSRLLTLPVERQRNALRRFIRAQHGPAPHTKHLDEIFTSVIHADASAQPVFCWDHVEIRRYQHYLYLLPQEKHNANIVLPWNLRQPLTLPNQLGTLQVRSVMGKGIRLALASDNVTVRFRQGGERCRLAGHTQTQTLKQLMQTWQIPPWQRDRIPLIFSADELVTVVGYGVSEHYAAKPAEKGLLIDLKKSS